jgi:hypothetical protein
MVADEDI